MISASAAFLAANAKRQKKPVYLIRIQGYSRAFSNRDLGVVAPVPYDTFSVPSWVVPPVALGVNEHLLWMPVTSPVVLNQGGDPAENSIEGTGTAITLKRGHGAIGIASPSASWSAPLVGALPIPSSIITKIYGVVRGSFDGVYGGSTLASPTYPGDGIFVGTFDAWSGARYAPLTAFDPHAFPWGSFDLLMSCSGSLFWTGGPSIFETTDIGFLIYYEQIPVPPTTVPWLVLIEDHAVTVNDLDGGADLADLVFNVQDRGGGITADFPTFVFEGKKVVLTGGFEGMDPDDFVTFFTGRIDAVESTNANTEYLFTCPDVRQELTRVIFTAGDDGFPTDSSHPRTLNGNPLDMLVSVLESEVGLNPSDIDLAKIASYRNGIYAALQFTFKITSPPAAKDFIENELMKPLGAYIWSNESGQVTVNFYFPISPTPVLDFSRDNLIEIPEAGEADLVNVVSTRFDYDDNDKPQSELVRQDSASVLKYGQYGQHIIEARGLRSGLQGFVIAAMTSWLIFLRYSAKQLCFGSNAANSTSSPVNALWDACLVQPGDIVTVTHPQVPDRVRGVLGITRQTFVVMDRTRQFFPCLVQLKLLSIDLSKFTQYLITPNDEGAYTAVSSADKAKYMFQSNDSDQYSNGDAGNTLA